MTSSGWIRTVRKWESFETDVFEDSRCEMNRISECTSEGKAVSGRQQVEKQRVGAGTLTTLTTKVHRRIERRNLPNAPFV